MGEGRGGWYDKTAILQALKFFWGQLTSSVSVSGDQLSCETLGKHTHLLLESGLKGSGRILRRMPELSGCWCREHVGDNWLLTGAVGTGLLQSLLYHLCSSFLGSLLGSAEDA